MRRTFTHFFLLVAMFSGQALLGQGQPLPGLVVSVDHAHFGRSSLYFDWRIANASSKALYVYATFLNGPAAMKPSNREGVITVRTSLSETESVGVNGYPEAKFIRIEPGEVINGMFMDKTVG